MKFIRGVHYCIATVGGAGYLPRAPGTWGSLVALPLFYSVPASIFASLIPLFFIAGWYSTYYILRDNHAHNHDHDTDPSYIVVDELYAMMIVLIYSRGGVFDLAMAFILFRAFDIIKPWPIGWVDVCLKTKNLPLAAFGVMIDDALAAVMACAILHIIYVFV